MELSCFLRDKEKFKGVYINKDMTKLQMKEQYELRKELRRRREMEVEQKGNTNLIIRRGRITERNDYRWIVDVLTGNPWLMNTK